MLGMFVNNNGCVPYADAIAQRYKTIETRNKNMLAALVGQRVAIVKTGRGGPVVIGYVTITGSEFCPADCFDKYFADHLVQPGSKYAPRGRGKWFYYCAGAEKCDPFPLPENAVRHGRSWCEFEKS